MAVALVSFSMLFATLLLGYAVFRFTAESWPPMGMEPVPLTYPFISTVLILVSSVSFHFFQTNFFSKAKSMAKKWLVLTLVLGFGFMGSQVLLWRQLDHELGYVVETGVFASLIHVFTWVHAAHIVAGLLWLLWLLPALKESSRVVNYENRILNAGKFWHFLDLIWIIMFLTLFVL
jgi:cytochrome c oxidase subunit 3